MSNVAAVAQQLRLDGGNIGLQAHKSRIQAQQRQKGRKRNRSAAIVFVRGVAGPREADTRAVP
jgi:hypothetical protein